MIGKPEPAPRRSSVTDGNPAGDGDPAHARAGADAVRHLADSGLIAVVTATADGMITSANGAFLRLTGYSQADLAAGRINWRTMTPPEWEAADQAALAELHIAGSRVPFRKEYWRKDGSRVQVEISAVLLSLEPPRWTCFIRDASAEQQAQAAADRAAELASMAAALSHAATIAEAARALGARVRRSTGANLATLIEADPVRPVLRFADLTVRCAWPAGRHRRSLTGLAPH